MKKKQTIFVLTSLLFLTSCTGFPYNLSQPVSPASATPTPENPAIAATPEPQETPSTAPQENTLRIWLPPHLAPNPETEAGALLAARLEAFQRRRPEITLEVRIKATEGKASLLNSLIAAHAAAPAVMPDLVALSRPDMESAVEAGILHPIDGLATALDDPDWYPYARPLARIQNSAYGLPFTAQLLGLRYTPTEENPLPALKTLQEEENQILLPEASLQTDLSFCLYTAAGYSLQNDEGKAALLEEEFTNLLTFYQSEIFTVEESEKNLPVLWSDSFFGETPAEAILAPIPGLEETSCSLATAWLWTLAGDDPERQLASVELAEYLSETAFLAKWTAALGTLPPHPTLLEARFPEMHALSLAAQPYPSQNTIKALAGIFTEGITLVLQEQVEPGAAAQQVLEGIQ